MSDLQRDVERMIAELREHWGRIQVVGRQLTTKERSLLDAIDASMARLRIVRETMDRRD